MGKKRNKSTPEEILVSPQDVHFISARVWSIKSPKNKAHTSYAVNGAGGEMVRLHRLIMNASPEEHVDHINGNGLDNRRENLRIVTRSQNMMNAKHTRGKSRFKGVARHQNTDKWRAYIRDPIRVKQKHLGFFESEIDAARAYNKAAVALFGEFARLNEC